MTPVLRLASGREIAFDPTTIPPDTSVSVWVNQGLLDHASDLFGQPGSYGSVIFRYTSPSAGNLYATVLLSIHGEPISFPMRARSEAEIANAAVGNSLEGIWWQPSTTVNDVLVIGNHSDTKVSGTLGVFDASGKRWRQILVLGPHESQRMATSDLVKKAGLSGSYGGISFVTENPISAIDAAHFVYDEVSKFSTSEELTRRDPNATLLRRAGPDAKHWTMYAPMMALPSPDPALGLPRGIVLQPTLFVRNTTAKNIAVDLALTWRDDSATGQAKLPQLHLAPFATQQMQIGTMQPLLQIPDNAHWALVSLTTMAQPDDLIAIASSRDASGRYGSETRFIGGRGGQFAGGEWRADANHNSVAAITNVGTKPTEALLTLHYDGGKKTYELQQTIAAGDQMWVNLAQLIRNRVADRKGNTLPLDVNAVTYDLRDLSPGSHNLIANELAIDRTWGSSAIPACPECCSYDSIGFDPTSVDLFSGNTDTVAIDGINTCNGDPSALTPYFTDWLSENPAVAKVSYANVQGVAPGFTNGQAEGHVACPGECGCNFCIVQETLPVTVVPTVKISCDTTHLTIGATNFPGTEQGSCTTSNVSPAGGTFSWTTNNTSTISLTPNLGSADYTSKAASSSLGDTTITVKYTVNNQSASDTSQQITVHKPTSLKTNSTTPDDHTLTCTLPCLLSPGTGTCTVKSGTSCSYSEEITRRNYSVQDQFNPPNLFENIQLSGVTVTENVNANQGTCGGNNVETAKTGGSPFYDDFGKCDSCCETGGPGCTSTASQTILANGFSVRTESITVTCTSATLNP